MKIVVVVAVAVPVLMNEFGSVLLWRSPLFSRGPQPVRLPVICAVPVTGVAVAMYFIGDGHPIRDVGSGLVDELSVANGDLHRDHFASDHGSDFEGGSDRRSASSR